MRIAGMSDDIPKIIERKTSSVIVWTSLLGKKQMYIVRFFWENSGMMLTVVKLQDYNQSCIPLNLLAPSFAYNVIIY